MASVEQNEHETYRVIVLDRARAQVLLVPNGQHHILPGAELPRWQRVAENLTITFKSEWRKEVVVLFELPASNGGGPRYVAAEHLCTRRDSKMSALWVPLSELGHNSLVDAHDREAIEQVFGICTGKIEGMTGGPFARLGWFCDLRNWIESVIEPMGFHLTGEFRQLNASPSFSLVRFGTDGPALWFKAVGEPNQREYAITCTLAQLFPDYLSSILASRPDWNGWLSLEVRGKLLYEVQDQLLWERAAASLAKLQIQSIGRASQILGAGAHDVGPVALSKLIQPFMNVVAELMERQTKVPPPILDRRDLLLLEDSLQSAIGAMEAIGLPETLGHLDLNPGNIILSEKCCAFLDWAEAYVGNPLFSLQYLLEHARRALGADSTVETSLTRAFCAQWDGGVSPAAIADALTLAPLLAVFAYAAGSDAWKQPQGLQEPDTAGYLRSLARRMHGEASELAARRSLCLQ